MPDSATPAPARHHRRGWFIGVAVGLVLLAGALLMWRHDQLYPSTQDAYLQAHFTWVAPQVTGQVVEKLVEPNEFVHAGQPLFRIDPRPFLARLAQAQANQLLVGQQILGDQQRIAALGDLVVAEQDLISLTQQQYTRLQPLLAQDYASQIQGIQLQDTLAEQQAKLASLRAEQQQAITNLGTPEVQQARRQQAAAEVTLAQLNVEWCTVSAPADGWITQFNLRVGDIVQPGLPQFPFVESSHWWIAANFKETHMRRILPGQSVTFTVDMYPGHTFNGTVHSLARGVASSFSLLPPQNTTGNWVKVTQRVPIRILVNEQPGFPFRLGASVEVSVDTVAPARPSVQNEILRDDVPVPPPAPATSAAPAP
jgi:membrane fusion protein (multidrug efflux system)